MSVAFAVHRPIKTAGLLAAVVVLALAALSYRMHAQVSGAPNGRIVYFAGDSNNDAQIFVINPDGSGKQQLTHDTNENFDPAVSPDGRKIAYVADTFSDGSTQLFIMNADGTNVTQITNDDNFIIDKLAWSPDGSKLALMRSPGDFSQPSAIYTINADGSGLNLVVQDTHFDTSPSWHPSGTKLIFVCSDGTRDQLCTINADGSGRTQITSDSNYHDGPTYSPDGTQIAFTKNFNPYSQAIKVMNADTSGEHTIATSNTENENVSWSPDGTKLAFDNQGGTGGTQRIYYINTDGSGETGVTPDGDSSYNPSWSTVLTDSDGDGASDTTESGAPNNGDANNDGAPDQDQINVTGYVNPVTGKYTVLQSSCASNWGVSAAAAPASFKDAAFSYPAGIVSFNTTCTHGATATVTLYYYGLDYSSTLVLRKYNSSNHSYQTMPGAIFSSATIGGQAVTKVTYQIQDGGPFDQDGVANGIIVDPVGAALPAVGAPNTGLGGSSAALPRWLLAPSL